MSQKVLDYLAQQQRSSPDPQAWREMEELYIKKLWHNLIVKLNDYILKQSPKNLVEIYQNFLSDFESKVRPIRLTELAYLIVQQISNAEEKLAFINKIKEKTKEDPLSRILCNIIVGQIKLSNNDLKGAKEVIETTEAYFDTDQGVTNVHARFYQLAAEFHQRSGDHANYYRNALRYLGCCGTTGVEIFETEESQAMRAFTLALAAILGQDVYNFGELLLHPILNKLKPEHAYMKDLLQAFNVGSIKDFNALRPQWSQQSDLAANEIEMRKKICLMCLMELNFRHGFEVLTFSQIAQATHLQENEVELLVMKALSKELIKGSIDEVEKTVRITWVQPRAMNKEQINNMKKRVENWIGVLNEFSSNFEQHAREIMA